MHPFEVLMPGYSYPINRDPILPDNMSEHQQFKYCALDLINRIAGNFVSFSMSRCG